MILSSACLPTSPGDSSGAPTITIYGFSILKESLDNDILPAFKRKWKQEHGQDINFRTSFAGSETVTNQVIQGVPADIAIVSIDRDAQRLKDSGATTTDWHAYPQKGIINKTPFVILVRPGNPKGIHDFPDLAKPGVQIIHPDPVSSGGAQWSILAIYGSELMRSQAASGMPDEAKALRTLKAIWANVRSTPGSAREARTTFDNGYGDALVTYELEGLMMKAAGSPVEMVVPRSTIFSEHPIVPIDRNLDAAKRPIVDALIQYMWSDDAQRAFVKNHFRSVTNEALNDADPEFGKIELPFTIEMFGGWDKAYPDVIEHIFKDQVIQGKK